MATLKQQNIILQFPSKLPRKKKIKLINDHRLKKTPATSVTNTDGCAGKRTTKYNSSLRMGTVNLLRILDGIKFVVSTNTENYTRKKKKND